MAAIAPSAIASSASAHVESAGTGVVTLIAPLTRTRFAFATLSLVDALPPWSVSWVSVGSSVSVIVLPTVAVGETVTWRTHLIAGKWRVEGELNQVRRLLKIIEQGDAAGARGTRLERRRERCEAESRQKAYGRRDRRTFGGDCRW